MRGLACTPVSHRLRTGGAWRKAYIDLEVIYFKVALLLTLFEAGPSHY
jgi:hypothetical protein